MQRQLLLAALFFVTPGLCQTPVIGGSCRIGTADVQIGGKQTQFFLKCEPTSDSSAGEGVWVVKSRAAAAAAPATSASAVPVENTQPQQHPKLMRKQNPPNICEQDNNAREADACTVSATCLQASQDIPSSYLQCDQTSLRWVRKSCQDGFIFNFEQQTCIVPKRMSSLSPLHSISCPDGSGPLGNCPCTYGSYCTIQNLCCPLAPSLLSQLSYIAHPFGLKKHRRHPASSRLGRNHFGAATFAAPSLISMTSAVDEGVCALMSAPCQDSKECPSSFKCKNGCCHLKQCPSGAEVIFTCTNLYQCRAGEKCIFGGCCPQVNTEILHREQKKVEVTTVSADLLVKGEDDPYNNYESIFTRPHLMTGAVAVNSKIKKIPKKTTNMPSAIPVDECDLDNRVEDCNLSKPCPDDSECLSGRCCRIKAKRCANGLRALTVPKICANSDDCPIASLCEKSVCCPISPEREDEEELNTTDLSDKETSASLPVLPQKTRSEGVLRSTESTLASQRPNCLTEQGCSVFHGSPCPHGYTCTLDGHCCQFSSSCPDGSVPQSLCSGTVPCPTTHLCFTTEENYSICCVRGQQATSGLVCTYSSCSNSNPCSTGTCNNGYCCASGSIPSNAYQAVATRTRSRRSLTVKNSTTNELKENADWPVGPPGYGFPDHLADLDAVLVRAAGDGSTCAGGFNTSLPCSGAGECPPGLFCDPSLQHCCPLILPLIDANTSPQTVQSWKEELERATGKSPETRTRFSSRSRPCRANSACIPLPSQSSSCVGCAPPMVSAPMYAPQSTMFCPGGGTPIGSCSAGYCPTGFACVNNVCCPAFATMRRPQFPYPIACPTGVPPVGGCINGACATGYSCIQNQCCVTPVTKNPFVCPNGNQAAGGCVNGQCGAGYTCQNGLCCLGTTGSAVKCLDGSEAIGACIPSCTGGNCGNVQITYYCGTGYTCTTGNICCPISSCPNGGDPIGPPVNGLCPEGYNLQGNMCCSNVAAACPDGSAGTPTVNGLCPAGTVLTGTVCCPATAAATLVGNCAVPSMAIGPCTPAGCGVGYACDNDATNPQCCPVVNYNDPQFQIGPAVSGMCPVGYVAVYPPSSANADGTNDGVCVDLQTVPNLCAVAVQAGPCNNGACQAGYTCNTYADICCPTTTAFNRIRPQVKRPTYGRPLHNYMPPRPEVCADGSDPDGACVNSLCGVGFECQNGNCCPLASKELKLRSMCPNGEAAVSNCFANGGCGAGFECVRSVNLCCPPGGNQPPSSPLTVRPIGARCLGDAECVGHSEGLSLCHAGVCQCSPIAYTQGIACVRRKLLKMNDSPISDDAKSTNSV